MYCKSTCTLLDTLYLLEELSLISRFYHLSWIVNRLSLSAHVHTDSFLLYTALPISFRDFTFFPLDKDYTESKVTLGFTLPDNRLTIDYIANRTYIFEPVKRRLIQVNCLLNLRYEFKYDMAVNIIRTRTD